MPSFAIEQNLMEIIQVIYRGRGEQEMDKQGKELTFYLAERAIYGEGASFGRLRNRGRPLAGSGTGGGGRERKPFRSAF